MSSGTLQGQATFLLLASYLFIVAKAVPPSYQLSHPFIYPWMYFLPAYDSNYTSDPCCYGPDTPMTDNPEGNLLESPFTDTPYCLTHGEEECCRAMILRQSGFETDDEGWRVWGDVEHPQIYTSRIALAGPLMPYHDTSQTGYIWQRDPPFITFYPAIGNWANGTFGAYQHHPNFDEGNFWMYMHNASKWTGDWRDSYGGFLSFDAITFNPDPLMAQRDPLSEIRITGLNSTTGEEAVMYGLVNGTLIGRGTSNTNWITLSAWIHEQAGWEHKGYDSFGNRVDFKATAEYINMILENVVELAISGDFLQYRNDTDSQRLRNTMNKYNEANGIDNIRLWRPMPDFDNASIAEVISEPSDTSTGIVVKALIGAIGGLDNGGTPYETNADYSFCIETLVTFSGGNIATTLQHQAGSHYLITANPTVAATYSLTAFINATQQPMQPSPFQIQVGPGPAATVIPTYPANEIHAGALPEIAVDVFDQYGNQIYVQSARDLVTVVVEYNLQTTVSTIESNMTTGGLYETVAELPQATLIGQYNITVSLEGTEVGFKSITVIPGLVADLDLSLAQGQGLIGGTADDTLSIIVSAADEFGNFMRDSSGFELSPAFQSLVTTTAAVPISGDHCEEGFDCRLRIEYAVTSAGEDLPLQIVRSSDSSALLNGMTWLVDISHGIPSATASSVVGLAGSYQAGAAINVTLVPRDQHGNPVETSSIPEDSFHLELRCGGCPSPVPGNLSATRDFEFDATLLPTYASSYDLWVVWGAPTSGSRNVGSTTVTHAALDPSASRVTGVTTDVVAGGMLEYRVEALDPYGNPVLSTPSVSSLLDNPALSPAPSSPLSCSSLDSPGDASALIRCIALDAGNFTLPVTVMGGQPLAGSSPLAVAVSPASPSGTTTRAYGPGTVGGRAGEILEVHLAAADLYGNELTVGGAVVAASFGPAGSLTTGAVTVTDHGNGTYTVAYSVEQLPTPTPGQLSLTIDGQPLQDSPWSPAWTAALPASIPNSTMTVIVNTTDGRLAAGEWTRVGTVTLRDRYGNIATGTEHEALLSGALNPESTIIEDSTNPIHAAGQVALSVHPDGDTFVLYALAQVAGRYDGDVQYSGQPVQNNADLAGLVVASQDPGDDHHQHWVCFVRANAGDGILAAGEVGDVSVWQLDAYGNRLWAGGSEASASQAVLLEKTEAGIVTQTSFSNHSTGPQVGVVTIPFMFTSATPAGQTWAIDVSALFPHPPGPSATHTVCGGTMHFDVTPAPPHLPSTLLFGPGLDNATAGQVASFTMALQDEYGNAVDVDLASVSAYLVPTSGEGPNVLLTTRNGSQAGEYLLDYTATAAGTYELRINISGEEVPGSYAPEVYPGSVDYPSTVVTTEPASGAIAAGGNFTVTAILRDAYGNVVPGGDDLSTLFVGPSGQLLPATSVDRGNGTLAFQVQPTAAGSYDWALHAENTTSVATGSFQVEPDGFLASASSMFGADSVASGTKGKLFLDLRDAYGNRLAPESSELSVVLTGRTSNETVSAALGHYDLARNAYQVLYQPKSADDYDLDVQYDGQSLPSNVTVIRVLPGQVDVDSISMGPVMDSVAGVPTTVEVYGFDANGNPVGADQFVSLLAARIPSAANASIAVVAASETVAHLTFTMYEAGAYTLQATAGGTPLQGSPKPFIVASGPFSYQTSHATGAGLLASSAGLWNEVALIARDAYGNPVNDMGNITWSITGPGDAASTEFTHGGGGRFVAEYMAKVEGIYEIAIAVEALGIAGSPFRAVISRGEAVPGRSNVTLAHGPSPNASDAITVVVSVNDAHGNVVQNATASLLVEVTAPANGVQPQTTSQVPVANTASSGGLYTGVIPPGVAGNLSVAAFLNGTPVGNSPAHVFRSPGEAAASTSTFTGSITGNFTAGDVLDIVVDLRDDYGNAAGGSSLPVTVHAKLPDNTTVASFSISAPATTAEFQVNASGLVEYSVMIGSSHLSGSPLVVNGSPSRLSLEKSHVHASSWRPSVGEAVQITLQGEDVHGNTVQGGVGRLELLITYRGGVAQVVEFQDLGNGTFAASWTPVDSGIPNITIAYHGQERQLMPPLQIQAGHPDAQASKVVLDSEPMLIAGTSTVLLQVDVRDKFGNAIPLESYGGSFDFASVIVTDATTGKRTAADVALSVRPDNTLQAEINVTAAGKYSVDLEMHGKTVTGSPILLQVLPGAISHAHSTVLVPTVVSTGTEFHVHIWPRDAFSNPITVLPSTERLQVGLRWLDNFTVYGQKYELWVSMDPFQAEPMGSGEFVASLTLYDSSKKHVTVDVLHANDMASSSSPKLHLDSSPYLMEVQSKLDASPNMTRYALRGGALHTAGESIQVDLITRDRNGSPASLEEGAVLQVQFAPASSPSNAGPPSDLPWISATRRNQSTTDSGQGGNGRIEYAAIGKVERAGDYLVNLRVLYANGTTVTIPGTRPLRVEPAPTSPSTSMAWVAGGSESLVAGEPLSVDVAAYDAYGNKRASGGDAFTVHYTLRRPLHESVHAVPVGGEDQQGAADYGDGTYSFRALLTKSGTYDVTVKLNGSEVAGMPLHLDVEPAALSLESSRLHGSLLSPDGVRAGAVVEFRLDGFDIYKNAVTEENSPIYFRLCERVDASAGSCRLADVELSATGPGQFTSGDISITKAGTYMLQVYNSNGMITRPILILPSQPDVETSFVVTSVGEVMHAGTRVNATAGQQVSYVLHVRDKFNNIVPLSGPGDIPLASLAPKAAPGLQRPVQSVYNMHTGVVEPASNGAIGVNMSIMTAGGYNLMILMPHHSSPSSLLDISISPGDVDLNTSSMAGRLPGDAHQVFHILTGVASGFQVHLRDAFGNTIAEGNHELCVTVHSKGMGDVLASDSMIGAEAAASDGTWTVSMQAAVAGVYDATVRVCHAQGAQGTACAAGVCMGVLRGAGDPVPLRVLAWPLHPPNITSVRPASGPIEGGTILTLAGTNFFPSEGIRCIFGGQRTPAEYVLHKPDLPPSASNRVVAVTCPTPPASVAGATAVTLRFGSWPVVGIVSNASSELPPFDDSSLESASATFTYTDTQAANRFLEMTPAWADPSFPGNITLAGFSLVTSAADQALCRFDVTRSLGRLVSSNETVVDVRADIAADLRHVSCPTPTSFRPGSVAQLYFSVNGQEFVPTGFEVPLIFDSLPKANPDHATVAYGQSIVIDVLDNDEVAHYEPVLQPELVQEPAFGTAFVSTDRGKGVIRYQPHYTFDGKDSLVYMIKDALQRPAEGLVTISGPPSPPFVIAPAVDLNGVEDLIVPASASDFLPPFRIEVPGDPSTLFQATLVSMGGKVMTHPADGIWSAIMPLSDEKGTCVGVRMDGTGLPDWAILPAEGQPHADPAGRDVIVVGTDRGPAGSSSGDPSVACSELSLMGTAQEINEGLRKIRFKGHASYNGNISLSLTVCREETSLCTTASQSGWLAAVNDAPVIEVRDVHYLGSVDSDLVGDSNPGQDAASARCMSAVTRETTGGASLGLLLSDPDAQDWRADRDLGLTMRVLLSSPSVELHFPYASPALQLVLGRAREGSTEVFWGGAIAQAATSGLEISILNVSQDAIPELMPEATDLELDWSTPRSIWLFQGPLVSLNKLFSTIVCCRASRAPRTVKLQVQVSDLANYGEDGSRLGRNAGTGSSGNATAPLVAEETVLLPLSTSANVLPVILISLALLLGLLICMCILGAIRLRVRRKRAKDAGEDTQTGKADPQTPSDHVTRPEATTASARAYIYSVFSSGTSFHLPVFPAGSFRIAGRIAGAEVWQSSRDPIQQVVTENPVLSFPIPASSEPDKVHSNRTNDHVDEMGSSLLSPSGVDHTRNSSNPDHNAAQLSRYRTMMAKHRARLAGRGSRALEGERSCGGGLEEDEPLPSWL